MAITQLPYALKMQTSMRFDEAVDAVKAAFKAEGFGVLTEIDVSATMKAKLGVDTPPYVILGMCNPELAHRSLAAEIDIGALLPCNVAVYEHNGKTAITAQDPSLMVSMTGNKQLEEMAAEAAARVRRAMDSLQ